MQAATKAAEKELAIAEAELLFYETAIEKFENGSKGPARVARGGVLAVIVRKSLWVLFGFLAEGVSSFFSGNNQRLSSLVGKINLKLRSHTFLYLTEAS